MAYTLFEDSGRATRATLKLELDGQQALFESDPLVDYDECADCSEFNYLRHPIQ